MMRTFSPKTITARIASGVVVMSLLLGIALGAAWASRTAIDLSLMPNTAGIGGSPRPVDFSSAALRPTPSDVLNAVLRDAGATEAVVVGESGVSAQSAELIAVRLPNGNTCFTASHAGGKIAEPLNCSSDAYLRVWSDAHGSPSDLSINEARNARLLVLVATEVNSVRVSLADGSTRTLVPDNEGVATIQTAEPENRPIKVEALAKDGAVIASIPL